MAEGKFGRVLLIVGALGAGGVVLAACEGAYVPEIYERGKGDYQPRTTPRESVLGEGGLTFGGDKKKNASADQGAGIGVNSFLWRASLDTISFMPVTSADPFGGVIITDWHSITETPDERFKLNVYILGRQMRADGVRVAVFRQVRDTGGWRDATVPERTGTKIEDAILMKARQLRNETLQK